MDDPIRQTLNRFPYRVNPHVEHARAHLAEWVEEVGLVQRDSARKRLERADFGWFAAMVYPTADRAHLDLMADWFAWLFLVDDELDDGAMGRSPQRLKEVMDAMRAVLVSDDFSASVAGRRDLPAGVSSLADLWRRTAPDATPRWCDLFARHLGNCLTTAADWEAGNRVDGTVPDKATYIEKRRHTGAIYVCMDLIDIVERIDVPAHVYDSQLFTTALNAACNVVCWTNDVYSLEKERALGEVHNLVYVVEQHHGLERPVAVSRVCAAVEAETELFLSAERELLAAYPEHADVVRPYTAGMRSWMRGNVDWSSRTRRYRQPGKSERSCPWSTWSQRCWEGPLTTVRAYAIRSPLALGFGLARSVAAGPFGPDSCHRDGVLSRVGDDVGGASVGARGLAVPDGDEVVDPVDQGSAGRHVGLGVRVVVVEPVDRRGFGEQPVVLGMATRRQAVAVFRGGDDDLQRSAGAQHGVREDLVGAVGEAGDADQTTRIVRWENPVDLLTHELGRVRRQSAVAGDSDAGHEAAPSSRSSSSSRSARALDDARALMASRSWRAWRRTRSESWVRAMSSARRAVCAPSSGSPLWTCASA
jgi:Terpene synthase family 2, C-terminal metal binding